MPTRRSSRLEDARGKAHVAVETPPTLGLLSSKLDSKPAEDPIHTTDEFQAEKFHQIRRRRLYVQAAQPPANYGVGFSAHTAYEESVPPSSGSPSPVAMVSDYSDDEEDEDENDEEYHQQQRSSKAQGWAYQEAIDSTSNIFSGESSDAEEGEEMDDVPISQGTGHWDSNVVRKDQVRRKPTSWPPLPGTTYCVDHFLDVVRSYYIVQQTFLIGLASPQYRTDLTETQWLGGSAKHTIAASHQPHDIRDLTLNRLAAEPRRLPEIYELSALVAKPVQSAIMKLRLATGVEAFLQHLRDNIIDDALEHLQYEKEYDSTTSQARHKLANPENYPIHCGDCTGAANQRIRAPPQCDVNSGAGTVELFCDGASTKLCEMGGLVFIVDVSSSDPMILLQAMMGIFEILEQERNRKTNA